MDIGHIHTFLPQPVVRRVVMLLQHMHTLHLWNIHTLHINLFTLGGENSGGAKNTFQTTQALPRITKRNEWTRGNEKNFVVTNFIISFSLFLIIMLYLQIRVLGSCLVDAFRELR
jgi:hypothetical protein